MRRFDQGGGFLDDIDDRVRRECGLRGQAKQNQR
jgi:hypothetical protein